MATIQGVYIALFGRPADPTGLAYFNGVTNNGQDLAAIGNLAGQPEYTSRFEGKSSADIIIDIYQSLFGRNPEQAGLSFFVEQLSSGKLSINNIAIAILDGAQGDDKATVTNKLAAADAFTKAIDTPDEVAAYRGNGAADAGRAFLAPIGPNTATIPTQTQTDLAVKAIVDGAGDGSGGVGTEIFFTAGTDTFTPTNGTFKTTAADDTITALVKGLYTDGDLVVGGGGTDTINAVVQGALVPAVPVAGELANIITESVEKINLTAVTQALVVDTSGAVGLEQLTNVNSTVAFTANNVAKGVVAGVEGTVLASTFAYVGAAAASGADTVELSLKGAAAGAVSLTSGAGVFEKLAITVDGSSSTGALQVNANAAGNAASVTVEGSGNLTLGATSLQVTSELDASGLTGGVNWAVGAGGVAFTGGKGSDVITLGAGNDTLIYNSGNISTKAVVDSYSGIDFVSTVAFEDRINVKAFAFDAAVQKFGVLTSLTDGSDFKNAADERTAASTFLDGNGLDLWIAFDTNNDGKYNEGSDLVVKLVGGAAQLANLDVGDVIWA